MRYSPCEFLDRVLNNSDAAALAAVNMANAAKKFDGAGNTSGNSNNNPGNFAIGDNHIQFKINDKELPNEGWCDVSSQ